jgi:hypothetical protein
LAFRAGVGCPRRAHSSAAERRPYKADVTGSIPVAPTQVRIRFRARDHITDDAYTYATALERAVTGGDYDPPLVPRCHEVLRGYSWVTICAAELAVRLGGAGALAASGAFDEVTELPGGQVFLRATPTLDEYQGEVVRRCSKCSRRCCFRAGQIRTCWPACGRDWSWTPTTTNS